MRLLVLALMFVFVVLLQVLPVGGFDDLSSLTTISLGLIMICAFLAGKWGLRVGFPLITGYVVAGIVCGPQLLGIFSEDIISELKLIDSIAFSLIALAAGGEIRWNEVRKSLRGLLSITGFQSFFMFAGIFVTALLSLRIVPFFAESPSSIIVSAALLLSVTAAANSPSTVIAVITELRARGSVTESILSVTVLKDVLVIIAFAGALALSGYLTGPGGSFDSSFITGAIWEISASVFGGIVLGFLLIFYISKVRGELALFMIGISFLSTELFLHFELHPLLATVVAGFVVQNFSPHGNKFIESLEKAALPVFIVFFAITGAGLDLSSLTDLWELVLILFVARIFWIFVGTYVGALVAREKPMVRKVSWLGYLPQAGVSIGLAILIADAFPGWGEVVKDIAISVIAINQLLGPVGLKYAIVRAGEARDDGGDEDENDGPVSPFHVMIRSYRI